MTPELKAKWIAALRSGEYQRGKGSLFRDGRHCCLGVLCAVMGVTLESGDENGYSAINKELPASSHYWYMNDAMDQSFAQIADYIESHL